MSKHTEQCLLGGVWVGWAADTMATARTYEHFLTRFPEYVKADFQITTELYGACRNLLQQFTLGVPSRTQYQPQ